MAKDEMTVDASPEYQTWFKPAEYKLNFEV